MAPVCRGDCPPGGGVARRGRRRSPRRSGSRGDRAGGSPAAAPAAVAPGAASPPPAAAVGNAGQIITWALVPLLGLGAGFIGERRRGTMRRIRTTPAPRGVALSAGVAAEVAGALVQIMLLASFGTLVFRLTWFSHPLELLGLAIAFCCAGAALGALLGAVCRTQRQASSLGLAISLGLAVFGGCWYPTALFPAGLRSVTRLDLRLGHGRLPCRALSVCSNGSGGEEHRAAPRLRRRGFPSFCSGVAVSRFRSRLRWCILRPCRRPLSRNLQHI